MLSRQDVEHIADLARIELIESEKEKYQAQLGKVLDYFKKLEEVKTEKIPTADGGTRELYNIWRPDEQRFKLNDSEPIDLVDMAPDKNKGQIKVKSVF